MSKKILVIGGAGFLGKSLLEALVRVSGDVSCADLADPGIPGVNFQKLDLLTGADVTKTLTGYDTVINCTGQITNPIHGCYRLNTEGIQHIVRGVSASSARLIHFSTTTVYGSCAFAHEETPVNPETPYSACKAFAEYLIRSCLAPDRFCVLRLSNLYGERQQKGVFNYLRKSYLTDRKLQFNNNGELLRYYLHVDDCAELVAGIAVSEENQAQGVYNLAGPEKYTLKQLVGLCEEVTSCTFSTAYEDIVPWDNTLEIGDEKIRNFTHAVPKRSLRAALKTLFTENNP